MTEERATGQTRSVFITKILVPVDFSEQADHALAAAVQLSRTLGAKLHIVHVAPLMHYFGPPFAPGRAFARELSAASREKFDGYMVALAGRGIEAAGTFAEGSAYAEINRVASEVGADLVVIGTHGWTGIQHALLGSVAERIVRTSPVPVMVVPLPKIPHAWRGEVAVVDAEDHRSSS